MLLKKKKITRLTYLFSKEITEKIQKISKTFLKDFESIQFPSSHLEAENPFGLVYTAATADCKGTTPKNFDKVLKSQTNKYLCMAIYLYNSAVLIIV